METETLIGICIAFTLTIVLAAIINTIAAGGDEDIF